MRFVISNEWLLATALAAVGASSANRAIAQATRATLGSPEAARPAAVIGSEIFDEFREVKRQLEELQRSDAAKAKQIDELQRRIDEQSELRESGLTEFGPLVVPRLAGTQDQTRDSKSALDRAIRDLESKQQPPGQESPLDRALRGLSQDAATQPIASRPIAAGAANLQLIDVSLDGLFAAGSSTERDESLQSLQGGGHDPRKRGFTVQNVELYIAGAVDPYFDAEVNLIWLLDPIEGETVTELEEAFLTTRALPRGLQLEMGQFFTEFGRINPNHPHSWQWQDQPIINSRLFGPDGVRNPGFRLAWLLPVDWFSQLHVGVQNAGGETTQSFLANDEVFGERPVGGRPFTERDVRALDDLLYLVRWENSWTRREGEVTWLVGSSALFGPNATGPDGHTEIVGLDLLRKWRPSQNQRGWPFVVWQSEIMYRRYAADNFSELGDPLDPLDDIVLGGDTLGDWGLYTQLFWGCSPRWAYGVRYEFVRGSGPSLDPVAGFAEINRDDDPFRDNRHRVAPIIAWYPTEFSRFRFQYNYDHAEHIGGKDAHSFWLGAEFSIGAHPAHKF